MNAAAITKATVNESLTATPAEPESLPKKSEIAGPNFTIPTHKPHTMPARIGTRMLTRQYSLLRARPSNERALELLDVVVEDVLLEFTPVFSARSRASFMFSSDMVDFPNHFCLRHSVKKNIAKHTGKAILPS